MCDFLNAFGYEVTDGGERVTQARSTQPDLILLDIQLPVFDGYEATWQIKADLGLKTTRFSSFAMKGDDEKARVSGCAGYVTKPYSPVKLLRAIRGFVKGTK